MRIVRITVVGNECNINWVSAACFKAEDARVRSVYFMRQPYLHRSWLPLHRWISSGVDAALRVRPPRQPGESLQVLMSGPWRSTVYLDAATGQALGRRGHNKGIVNQLFELRSRLFLEQDTGRTVRPWPGWS